MSNQLNRFQGQSETRWPLPELPEEASGGNRKALSRYIGNYIAKLEESDAKLRQQRANTTTNNSPDSWNSGHTKKLRMTRQEYVKRQNALYRELTGQKSWADVSEAESSRDAKNAGLMSTLELYMAALDEKIYMSADHTRAMVGIRDKMVRDEYDFLMEEKKSSADTTGDESKPLVHSLIELRDLYRDLWMQHVQLSNQRDILEVEAATLRYDQALQLGKVCKLQYATHSLGQKLIDAQKWRYECDDLKDELKREQRERESLQRQNEALTAKYNEQSDLLKRLVSQSSNSAPKDVESRIHVLFEDVCKLKATTHVDKDEPKSPLHKLDTSLKLVEVLKDENEKRIALLIESFGQQYRTREQELLMQVATLEKEKQIILARYDKLEKERDATVKDMGFLEERTLSLVYLLKTARASLDGMDEAK